MNLPVVISLPVRTFTNAILGTVILFCFSGAVIWATSIAGLSEAIRLSVILGTVIAIGIIIGFIFRHLRSKYGILYVYPGKDIVDLNRVQFNLEQLTYFRSKTVSSKVPQANFYASNIIEFGVNEQYKVLLDSQLAAKFFSNEQLEALEYVVYSSPVGEDNKLVFKSFMETVRVIKGVDQK